jgi:cytochrome c2
MKPWSAIVGGLALFGAVLSGSCKDDSQTESSSSADRAEAAPVAVLDYEHAPEPAADDAQVTRGRRMVGKYECNRCHEIEKVAAAEVDFDCAGCHRKVMDGTLPVDDVHQLQQWQKNVTSLLDVPTLTATSRFRRAWLTEFLQDTHDLRPGLRATMPRFAMPEKDAASIAAFLSPEAEDDAPVLGDATAGRKVLEDGGCMVCHRMTGVDPVPAQPVPVEVDPMVMARALKLAPDLRYVRDRYRPSALKRWLADPSSVKTDAAMPKIPLDEQQIADVSAFLLTAELAPLEPAAVPDRLPVLSRAVSYEEVHDRVFGRICRHCHSDPSVVAGGGPGFTGGFGFDGRKLDLSSYEGIVAGSLDDEGQRRSVLEPLADGTPRLVAHLWARHAESMGRPRDDVRGMPLGLPPLALEDIQLVETWIAQGAKRG